MTGNKAVVLLSGGIDSSTTLAIAKSEGYDTYALSFDYNQRHKRELLSAQFVASAFEVQRHLIIQFDLREIGGSALTDDIAVPKQSESPPPHPPLGKGGYRRGNSLTNIPVTYVPARNTIFLSFALAWAEVLYAEHIFIGANAIDYSGYPDCRPEYLKAYEVMANLATKVAVEKKVLFHIQAPLIHMKKSEIINKGVELGLDYSLTWSCYDPQPKKVKSEKLRVKNYEKENFEPRTLNSGTVFIPCGRCDSCIFRAKGFREAGIKDPLIR
jgi:7-cyano-7-deazaguanine synthase